MKKTVLVFGANGNVGSQFVNQALEACYKIKAFVRSPGKYTLSENPNVEVVKGDATNFEDVEKAVSGVDIIVSCLGNPSKKKIYIMDKSYEVIMLAASKQPKPPRCLMKVLERMVLLGLLDFCFNVLTEKKVLQIMKKQIKGFLMKKMFPLLLSDLSDPLGSQIKKGKENIE